MKRTIITLLTLLSLSLMVPAAYAQEYIVARTERRTAQVLS